MKDINQEAYHKVRGNFFTLLQDVEVAEVKPPITALSYLTETEIEVAFDPSQQSETRHYIHLQYFLELFRQIDAIEKLDDLGNFIKEYFSHPEFAIEEGEEGELSADDIDQLNTLRDFIYDDIRHKKEVLLTQKAR